MDAMLHCRKARVEDGGDSSIPLLLQPIHWFSFLFFLTSILILHLDCLPKALYDSMAQSLHRQHSAGIELTGDFSLKISQQFPMA